MSRTPASSREELERIQLAKLRELLAAVRPNNGFYEARLGQAGIDNLQIEVSTQAEPTETITL